VRNLEVELPGRRQPEKIIIIGAHYDSVRGSPGANDNGSGVAALLARARLFAGKKPELTVRFVAFVNEEPPYFRYRQYHTITDTPAKRVYDKMAIVVDGLSRLIADLAAAEVP
jgi:Zn-dependent M28 family amino/carboxypeptidase